MTPAPAGRPGLVGRIRSRQAGLPTGPLGRIIGRAMVKDTAAANDRALALLDLGQPRTVLDVGFGHGRTAAKLLAAGHRVLGVDASPTMVSQATARSRAACRDGRATLVHGDGIASPFPTGSADAALTVHTLYFMADPATTMVDIARVLRPGDRMVIACRTSDDPIPRWMDPNVYRIPASAQLDRLLRVAGFIVTTHHASSGDPHHTNWFVGDLPS